jgi:hypothetical protein
MSFWIILETKPALNGAALKDVLNQLLGVEAPFSYCAGLIS